MIRYLNFCCLILSLYFFVSCAIQVSPQGGPKDITPPKIIKEVPSNKTINFSKEKIELYLNEYSKLNNPGQEIIISPLITPEPKINTKKKTIIIKFEEKLKENTTYTIQFGKSIADITENNVLEDYMYIFSTGPKMDSITLKGSANEILTNTYKENVKILLYLPGNDSSVCKIRPEYYSKTNKKGDYIFNNLHANKYMVYAIEDENGNYKYDKGEYVAFYNSEIDLNKNSELQKLNLFKENEESLKAVDYGAKDNCKYFIAINSVVDSINLTQLFSNSIKIKIKNIKLNESKDTAYFWINRQSDSLKFIVNMYGENMSTDTLLINIEKKETKMKVTKKITLKPNIDLYTKGNMTFQFNQPLLSLNSQKIMLYCDTIKLNQHPGIVFNDSAHTSVLVKTITDPGKNYKIIIPKGTITGFDSVMNDSIVIPFRTLKETELGLISANIIMGNSDIPVIVQLLDERQKIVRQSTITSTTKLSFEKLLPGKYFIRCILDKNKNSKWDTGNLMKKRQPEDVIFYKEDINLKANWEINDLTIRIP